jgi:hypothetical protein
MKIGRHLLLQFAQILLRDMNFMHFNLARLMSGLAICRVQAV